MSEASDRVRFIEHKGKRILYIDFSHAAPEKVLAVIEVAEAVISEEPPSSLLTLTNMEKVVHDREVDERLKCYVERNKPYVITGAVVGLNEARKVIFSFLNEQAGRDLREFDDLEAARDWLAVQ